MDYSNKQQIHHIHRMQTDGLYTGDETKTDEHNSGMIHHHHEAASYICIAKLHELKV